MGFQQEVGTFLRTPGPDTLGEGEIIANLGLHLELKGHMTMAEFAPWALELEWFTAEETAADDNDQEAESGSWAPVGGTTTPVDEGSTAGDQPPGAPDTNLAQARGYVISITGRRSRRRVHHLGKCWRVPGKHYLEYEVHGEVLPPPESYHEICKTCWPSSPPTQQVERTLPLAVAGGSSSSSSGSSSSSSSEA